MQEKIEATIVNVISHADGNASLIVKASGGSGTMILSGPINKVPRKGQVIRAQGRTDMKERNNGFLKAKTVTLRFYATEIEVQSDNSMVAVASTLSVIFILLTPLYIPFCNFNESPFASMLFGVAYTALLVIGLMYFEMIKPQTNKDKKQAQVTSIEDNSTITEFFNKCSKHRWDFETAFEKQYKTRRFWSDLQAEIEAEANTAVMKKIVRDFQMHAFANGKKPAVCDYTSNVVMFEMPKPVKSNPFAHTWIIGKQ